MATLVIKITVGLLLVVVVTFGASVTGVLFKVWPTFWPDEALVVTASELNQLKAFRAAPKFYEEVSPHYPGSVNQQRRVLAEAQVNSLLDSLLVGLGPQPHKSFVLRQFKIAMMRFPTDDSEDMEQFCRYLEAVMNILRISSSNELLNVWRYGFPFGWLE
jgi:hypothetical protein